MLYGLIYGGLFVVVLIVLAFVIRKFRNWG